jgi:arginyl-tRNA synthetase
VAHGRQAAIGDALGNILKFYGLDVTKEYFINDDGRQIKVLGESIMHHYLGLYGVESPFPEDGYQGGYVKDIAVQIKAEYGDKFVNDRDKNRQFFSDYGVNVIMNILRKDLDAFDVRFDTWFSQKTLTREVVDAALNELKGKGYVFESEGAVWFKATAFGDEKDRVVVKSDGLYTYFART